MNGIIHFDQMNVEKELNGQKTVLKIRRTENRNRQRPNAEERHGDEDFVSRLGYKLGLINPKDLEWLAWNWRSWNNQKMFKSRRLMIFGHFNRSLGILPTPEQILHGIV